MKRLMLDTCVVVDLLLDPDGLDRSVVAILEDPEYSLCASFETMRELVVLFNNKKIFSHHWKKSEDKKSAIIYDENGNIVKEFKDILAVSGFRNGVAIIRKVEERPGSWVSTRVWYYIDVNGKPLSNTMVATDYSEKSYRLFPLREGLAPSYQKENNTGKWGFLNAQCQWVINPQFDDLGADEGGGFYNGLSRACDASSKKWGFINKQGQWVIQPTYTNRPGNFYTQHALVTDKSGNKYFMDMSGKLV